MVYVAVLSFIIKTYNVFIYNPKYYGSWSNFWKSPLIDFDYFPDYWSQPFHIILYALLFGPPLFGFILVWVCVRIIDKEDEKEFERKTKEEIEQILKKSKKHQKKNKRKNKSRKKINITFK